MVKIRLSRAGANKRPFYHIVAADERAPLNGRYIERIGFFNPIAKGAEPPFRIDMARFNYWREHGAKESDRVADLVKTYQTAAATAA